MGRWGRSDLRALEVLLQACIGNDTTRSCEGRPGGGDRLAGPRIAVAVSPADMQPPRDRHTQHVFVTSSSESSGRETDG